jgi:hypothetical protein
VHIGADPNPAGAPKLKVYPSSSVLNISPTRKRVVKLSNATDLDQAQDEMSSTGKLCQVPGIARRDRRKLHDGYPLGPGTERQITVV